MSDMEDFDFENKKIQFDLKNLKEGGVSWWTRVLLRVSPLRGVKRLSRELGVNSDVANQASEFFQATERIDIIPSKSGLRGFQLIIDGSTALYFHQDGDHFIYGGWETGKYEKGEVTVFD
ncbi:MAG: hypothetical protein G01um10143_593 [Parcubacteria group bacterium Gr01-1014_3]|nr:MAG: hypothetical protein G01um10143_593 [Parcubacteria group bacterium Gr01-1014_3]